MPKDKIGGVKDIVFVWTGGKAHPDDTAILQSVCKQLYSKVSIAESSAQDFGSWGTNDHTKLEFGN